jgi:translation initiation factor 1
MADDLSSIAGLPDELDIEEDLARAQQVASIRVDTRRYGKAVTIVDGLDPSTIDLDTLASTLKSRLAVGGTVSDGRIELQGDHRTALPEILRDEGFDVER